MIKKKNLKIQVSDALGIFLKSSSLITSYYSSNFDLITILGNYIGW